MRKDEQPITSKGRKNPRDRIYHEYDLYLRSMKAGLQLKNRGDVMSQREGGRSKNLKFVVTLFMYGP